MAATSSVHLVPQANLNTYSDPPMFKLIGRVFHIIPFAHWSWRWLIAHEREIIYGRDAIINPCSNYHIQNLKWVDTEIVRLLSDPKTAKGASKPKKKKRKKPEEVIPKKVHTKASKKRAKPTSSSDSRQGMVPKNVDLTSLAEEGFQQPSIIGGEDRFNFLKGFLEVKTVSNLQGNFKS
ncbi:hypothetical protein C1H46_018858 [Malus baccata]|uniref:Uncharacterized protein n=1 Tax=Malus baccata TaxID=106549 RepID=A0A540MAC5_MALBA|nr:hypothetical protein C1H46_018858 [Malus baccata]